VKSTTTLYLKHKTSSALELVTFTASTGNVHPELAPAVAAAAQVAARNFQSEDWQVQHRTTIDSDSPPARIAEGSDCT
jgi:hypothetical protein